MRSVTLALTADPGPTRWVPARTEGASTRCGEAARNRDNLADRRTVDHDPMRIDIYRVFHVISRRHEAFDKPDVDRRVREYCFRVERDHFDLWACLRDLAEVVKNCHARLRARGRAWLRVGSGGGEKGGRGGESRRQSKAIKPCMSHIARTLHQLRTVRRRSRRQ